MRYRPRLLSPSKGAATPGRCVGAAVANAIAVAAAGGRGALVRFGKRRPSVGGDGSNRAGPPDDAEFSSPLPPYCRILQHVHPPSVDGRDDIVRRGSSPECARRIKVCYPRATPLAIDEGESQLAGGHDDHKWQRMRWWGCEALPLPRRKCSRRGDRGLLGPLLCRPVPALLLLPGATTRRGLP